jgi:pSer/pThr/pTyr-binding forkhead associated (FHA) protein
VNDSTDSPLAPHSASPAELKERLEAERQGHSFLIYRERDGEQRIHLLDGSARAKVTVGRAASCDIGLHWDDQVSGVHAELELIGESWAVIDEGMSRNGTFVNGERVQGRRRLITGDSVRFGKTVAVFRSPAEAGAGTTRVAESFPEAASLSDAQRRVLVALCEPFKQARPYATPATNQEIAAQLHLSVDAVKTHLRTLFRKFEIEDLPQNQKRARLVECAFESGLISERDL